MYTFDYIVGYYTKAGDKEHIKAGFLRLDDAEEYVKNMETVFHPTGFPYIDAPEGKYIYGETGWNSNSPKLFKPEEWETAYIYDAQDDVNIKIDAFLPIDRYYKIKKQNTR